jgi:hypothetical protein
LKLKWVWKKSRRGDKNEGCSVHSVWKSIQLWKIPLIMAEFQATSAMDFCVMGIFSTIQRVRDIYFGAHIIFVRLEKWFFTFFIVSWSFRQLEGGSKNMFDVLRNLNPKIIFFVCFSMNTGIWIKWVLSISFRIHQDWSIFSTIFSVILEYFFFEKRSIWLKFLFLIFQVFLF